MRLPQMQVGGERLPILVAIGVQRSLAAGEILQAGEAPEMIVGNDLCTCKARLEGLDVDGHVNLERLGAGLASNERGGSASWKLLLVIRWVGVHCWTSFPAGAGKADGMAMRKAVRFMSVPYVDG